MGGFSLIELVVGIFFLGIVTIAIVGLTTLGTRLAVESERQTVAQALVNEQIEYTRSLPYEEVGFTDASGDEPDGLLIRVQTVTRNQQSYGVTFAIELLDDEGNALLPSGGLQEPNADYKRVRVEASWTTSGGNIRSVAVDTLVAPGGNILSCTPGVASCVGGTTCPANGVCPNPEPNPVCPSEAYFCDGSNSQVTYATTDQYLYVYDNGTADLIGQYTGLSEGEAMMDLAIDSTGQLYGITDNSSNLNWPTKLYLISKSTAAVTYVADIDSTFVHVYTAADFLSDGRLAVGGPNRIKFVTLSGGAVTNVSEISLTGTASPVQFSGDLVERAGKLWFIGHTSVASGDLCFETTVTTGATSQVSLLPVGSSNTVLGAACEDTTCDDVRVFMRSGITKPVDAATCSSYPGDYPGTLLWRGATN